MGAEALTDERTIINALGEAQGVLSEYVRPGARNPEKTLRALLRIFDNESLARALEREGKKEKPNPARS
jgi:hypothetical protein